MRTSTIISIAAVMISAAAIVNTFAVKVDSGTYKPIKVRYQDGQAFHPVNSKGYEVVPVMMLDALDATVIVELKEQLEEDYRMQKSHVRRIVRDVSAEYVSDQREQAEFEIFNRLNSHGYDVVKVTIYWNTTTLELK